jgi:hypothetical protein
VYVVFNTFNDAILRPGLCLRVPGCANASLHRARSCQSYTGHYFHPSTKVRPSPYIHQSFILTSATNSSSSQLYQSFDTILLLSHGRTLYSGPGLFAPSDYFATAAPGVVPAYPQGYNVADYLLEVASDPHVSLFQLPQQRNSDNGPSNLSEKGNSSVAGQKERSDVSLVSSKRVLLGSGKRSSYATTFLTQLEYLSGREWKILRRWVFLSLIFCLNLTCDRRDKTLFFTHVAVATVLGVFCGAYLHRKIGF